MKIQTNNDKYRILRGILKTPILLMVLITALLLLLHTHTVEAGSFTLSQSNVSGLGWDIGNFSSSIGSEGNLAKSFVDPSTEEMGAEVRGDDSFTRAEYEETWTCTEGCVVLGGTSTTVVGFAMSGTWSDPSPNGFMSILYTYNWKTLENFGRYNITFSMFSDAGLTEINAEYNDWLNPENSRELDYGYVDLDDGTHSVSLNETFVTIFSDFGYLESMSVSAEIFGDGTPAFIDFYNTFQITLDPEPGVVLTSDGGRVVGSNGAAPIPEPGTIFLLGSGLAGMVLYRRRTGRLA